MKFSPIMLIVVLIWFQAIEGKGKALEKPIAKPIVIAHRGASGYVPEHTLAAYSMAILQGADFIEPDLVMTKDGHLVARHDNVLDLTTDVALRPEFASRKTSKVLDGVETTGWFSEDFTLEEIKTLRAVERIPQVRPSNEKFNGMFTIPTLSEVIKLAQAMEKVVGYPIGIYPETKHPTYFQKLGLSMEEPLVKILHEAGYQGKNALVYIQSFEVSNLKKLRTMTKLPLIQLLWKEGKPFDAESQGKSLDYDQMATAQGLRDIAAYADGVGPEKDYFILPRNKDGSIDRKNATKFIENAHKAGLLVHPYTFRAENQFLPVNLQGDASDPTRLGQGDREIKWFLELGVDGFFTDQANIGVRARDEFLNRQ